MCLMAMQKSKVKNHRCSKCNSTQRILDFILIILDVESWEILLQLQKKMKLKIK